MSDDAVYALDPGRMWGRDGEGRWVAWPVWAVQVRAPRRQQGDVFIRLALRLLRSGLRTPLAMEEHGVFPEDVYERVLLRASHAGLASQNEGRWSLTDPGLELLETGSSEDEPQLSWMFVCALTGDVVPGWLEHPLRRESRLDEEVLAPAHRDRTKPDPGDFDLRLKLSDMASWLGEASLAEPDEVCGPPPGEFVDESMGSLGDWGEADGVSALDLLDDLSIDLSPESKDHPGGAVPTGHRVQRCRVLTRLKGGAFAGEVFAACPFGATDGWFYAVRTLRVADPALAELQAGLRPDPDGLESRLAEVKEAVRADIEGREWAWGPLEILPGSLRHAVVESEEAWVMASKYAGSPSEVHRSLRVVVEAALQAATPRGAIRPRPEKVLGSGAAAMASVVRRRVPLTARAGGSLLVSVLGELRHRRQWPSRSGDRLHRGVPAALVVAAQRALWPEAAGDVGEHLRDEALGRWLDKGITLFERTSSQAHAGGASPVIADVDELRCQVHRWLCVGLVEMEEEHDGEP